MRFLLILVLLAGLAGSAFATPERSRAFQSNAHYYIGKGDWPSALIELKNAIQQDPENGSAWFQAGQVAQHLGDLDAAEEDFRSAASHGYDAAETDATLAEVLVKHDKYQLLLDQIAPGTRPAPLEARVLSARGYAYIGLKRVAGAQRSFETAISLDDKNAGARAGLAQVFVALGRLDDAEPLLVRATEDDPTLSDAWLLLGYVRMWMGNRPGALVPFEKAVELAPTSEPAHRARALYLASEDPERARTDIAFLLAQNPNHTIANFLDAIVKVRLGQVRDAESALQNIRDPESYPPAIYLLARINFSQGEYRQAEANVDQFLKLKPGNREALLLRAAVLLQRGANETAIAVLEKLVLDQASDAQALAMLADAYAAANQRDNAKATLDKIASLSTDPRARLGVAEQQNMIGDYDDALGTLEAAEATGPLPTESVSLLVADLIRANKVDEAWQAASAFSDQTKGSAEAQVVLGVVAMRRGGAVVARAYFEKAVELDPHLVSAAIDLAGTYRVEGNIAAARGALEKSFAQNKESLQLMLARADLERSQGNKAAELQWLELARVADPQATGPRFRLVTLYLDAKDAGKAVAVAREMQQISEGDANVLAALGEALLANGEQQSALTAFQQMVEASKGSPAALVLMARAYFAVADIDDAARSLRKALEAAPDDLAVQAAVVEFAARTEQVDTFIDFARQLRRDHPDNARIDELVGALETESGRPREAAAAYTQAVAKGAGRRAMLGLARAQANGGDVQAGIATIHEWLKRAPGDLDGRIMFAQFLTGSGQCTQAIPEYQTLVAERPSDPLLKNDLAWCYQATGDPRALMTAQDAQHLAPDIALVQDTLGWIMVQQGDVEGGVKFLQQAAQQDAATPTMKYHYAVALDRLGRRQEALQVLDEALSKNASFGEAKDAQLLQAKLGSQ